MKILTNFYIYLGSFVPFMLVLGKEGTVLPYALGAAGVEGTCV